ncbi:carbon-nitrogen hydrolase family protein [Roseiconus nitratireducens]|uniref:Carbon-nitrogen hydrolase family protein n=2 Tax=Roseiconus nitratireducens TaxID=2605748 RepID=A0A5M6CRN9_9BACT|nr:carbon-nitrogen hydrolase family protein [Roseiconus nitratireducens]
MQFLPQPDGLMTDHWQPAVRAFFLVGLLVTGATAQPAVSGRTDRVKVTAVQISGYDKGELPRADKHPVEQLIPHIESASRDRSQLVVFPEYVLGHIKVPGPETQRIAAAARAGAIYVIVGCWEVLDDSTFANTALVFDRGGEIVGKYRKTHAAVDHFDASGSPWQNPPAGKSAAWMVENDPEWIMQSGQELPVFELDFGKVGIMTCYDGWFPEPARILSLKGAELIVWINGRRGNVEDFIVRTTMFQSHVSIVTTNQAYGGGTMIGDATRRPDVIVARGVDRQESAISATLDLKKLRTVRRQSRNFRRRRPDLYGPLTTPVEKILESTLDDR